MGVPVLAITDGNTKITLIGGINVFYLNPDGAWRPALPPWKGGGTWQSSPISDGRQLVNRQWDNIIDSINIKASGESQDVVIFGIQELMRLLEKAVYYWTTDWQNEPVWMEARADCETNIRYAIISGWAIPELDDPYKAPFVGSSPVAMDNLTLTYEHNKWMAFAPGDEPCVEVSGKQLRYETTGTDTAAPVVGTDTGQRTDDRFSTAIGPLIMGNGGNGPESTAFRVVGVAIPAGAIITSAFVRFTAALNAVTTGTNAAIMAEKNVSPATFSSADNYFKRVRTEQFIPWNNIVTWAIGNPYDSPDISIIVQEIIDMTGWASGSDIVFFFDDNGSVLASFRTASAAVLHVTYVGGTIELGRDATCTDEVYIANKQNRAQLSHIYRDDVAGWSGNLLGGGVPYNLLSPNFVNGDHVYFGSDVTHPYGGPFCSLVFDLSSVPSDIFANGVWEYWNGAAWIAVNRGAPGLFTPTLTDNTRLLSVLDVTAVSWEQQTNWINVDLNTIVGGAPAIDAFWMRFEHVGVASASPVTQQKRDVYTALWNHGNLVDTELPGDIPALIKALLKNHSDQDGRTFGPYLYADRVIVAGRSVERGENFVSFINISDVQNPPTVSVVPGGSSPGGGAPIVSAFASRSEAPTGRVVEVTSNVNDEGFVTRATVRISAALALQYYGAYHAFLRLRQVEDSGNPGNPGDFTIRVKVASGLPENIVFTSDAYTTLHNGNDDSTLNWEAMDIGEVTLTAGQGITAELVDIYFLIQCSVVGNATHGNLVFYDLVLMPIDEWAGDFINPIGGLESALGTYVSEHSVLEITAINYKEFAASYLKLSDDIIMRWLTITNALPQMQANAAQQLHFFALQYLRVNGVQVGGNNLAYFDGLGNFVALGVQVGDRIYNLNDASSAIVTSVAGTEIHGILEGGIDNDWDNGDVALIITQHWVSVPYYLHSLQLFKQPRYLNMRGAR